VELILRHELTHVARGDLITSAAIALSRLPFPLHPTAHALAREASLARERAVDASVAALAPSAYARVLLDVAGQARHGAAPRAEVGMGQSDLARRVLAIVDPRPLRQVPCAPVLVAAFAVAGTMILAPRVCTSEVRARSHCSSHADCAVKVNPC
jgi:beta-lactamase regulating signal transducer with metallopeptidase domain